MTLLHNLLDFLAPRARAELINVPQTLPRGTHETRRRWLVAEQYKIMSELDETEITTAIGRKIENGAPSAPCIATLCLDPLRRDIGRRLLRLQVILRYLYSISLVADYTIEYEDWPTPSDATPSIYNA